MNDLAPGRGGRRLRWVAVALLAFFVLVFGMAALVMTTTRVDRLPQGRYGTAGHPTPPKWSRPCWRRDRRYDVKYTRECARVDGRVLYTQRRDPDGDGDGHLVVAAGTHVVIVKLRAEFRRQPLPGLGRRVRAVGVVTRGSSGRLEIDTTRLRR